MIIEIRVQNHQRQNQKYQKQNREINKVQRSFQKQKFVQQTNQQQDIYLKQSENTRMYSGGQIALLQEKVVRLQADNIIYLEEVNRLRRKVIELQEYRIKYELLLEKHTQQSPLDRSRREDEINNMNRKIEENNQKWINKMTTLEDKYLRTIDQMQKQIESMQEEGKGYGRTGTMKRQSKQQQQHAATIQQAGQQIRQLRTRNTQLIAQTTKIKEQNKQLQQKTTQLNQKLASYANNQERFQQQIAQAKQQQKQFYRETIMQLEKQFESLKEEAEYHRVRASPERELEINRLGKEIIAIEEKHFNEILRLTECIKEKDSQIKHVKGLLQLAKVQSHSLIISLQEQLKNVQQQNFDLKHQTHFQIMACRDQLQKLHQEQVDQLKDSFTTLQNDFQNERQQWQLILDSQASQLQRIKSQWEEDKEKYMDEKNKLKQKVQELKNKLKSNKQEEKLHLQEETKQLLENIKFIDEEENKYTGYENGVVFLHRQLKKSMMKIEQKQREINHLLIQLKSLRDEFQDEVQFIKKTQRSQVAYYKEKLLQADRQNGKLLSEIRDKQKHIRLQDQEHKSVYLKLQQENQSLKSMIQEMERDYNRVTQNKKELYLQYRTERDLVFTGKGELSQERKNKRLHLARQKNQLQIAYKEREKQLRNQYDLKINALNQQLNKISMEKQSQAAELQILKDKSENENNIDKKDQSERNMKDFHKKLASLDLQINLAQNLYATINSLKARTNKRSQVGQVSIISQSQQNLSEKQQNIQQMREMSLDSQQFVQINASPTFNNLSQRPREMGGVKNTNFQPHLTERVTNLERSNSQQRQYELEQEDED